MADAPRERRVDQLSPGDFVPFWGEDLEVVSAKPLTNDFNIAVTYRRAGQERIVIYGPGAKVEVTNVADKLRDGDDDGADHQS